MDQISPSPRLLRMRLPFASNPCPGSLVLLLTIGLFLPTAAAPPLLLWAQEVDADQEGGVGGGSGEEEAEEVKHVVIMEVPRGGTTEIGKAIYETPGVLLHKEGWLFERSAALGLPQDESIFSRVDILKPVMEAAQATLVIRSRYSPKENIYQIQFFDALGNVRREFLVPGTPEGMPEESAKKVGLEAKVFLAAVPEAAAPPAPPVPVPGQGTPSAAPEATQDGPPRLDGWAAVRGGVRLFKTALLIGSSKGAVNNYQSGFFPGYHVALDASPFLAMEGASGPGTLGVSLDLSQGFDTVNFAVDEEERQVSVNQTRVLAHVGYKSLGQTTIYGGAGVGYIGYSVSEENPALRDLSITGLILVGELTHRALEGKLPVHLGLLFMPVASWGESTDFYGSESSTFGAGAWAKGGYQISGNIHGFASYTFRINRTAFVGQGVEQFVDSVAMELTQMLSLGLEYNH